jgi:IclR family transcriptional regulator, acetate operon repressor
MPRPASTIDGSPTYPIGSVDSALRLLVLVGKRERVRISDASTELNVARSTAHRLMQMLQYHGFVEQDPNSKAYGAGPVLVGMGLQAVRNLPFRQLARSHMEALAEEVEETVILTARQPGTDVMCLDTVEGKRALRVGSRTGFVIKLHSSASGRALLSTLPTAEIMTLYPAPELPISERKSLRLRSELLADIEQTRDRGYAIQHDETEPDISVVAAPVRTLDGSGAFALAIMVATSRMSTEAERLFADAVVRHANELAASLPF